MNNRRPCPETNELRLRSSRCGVAVDFHHHSETSSPSATSIRSHSFCQRGFRDYCWSHTLSLPSYGGALRFYTRHVHRNGILRLRPCLFLTVVAALNLCTSYRDQQSLITVYKLTRHRESRVNVFTLELIRVNCYAKYPKRLTFLIPSDIPRLRCRNDRQQVRRPNE